ncbi:nucleoside hydrolase [Actinobacteria bacterium YIM 96077]|uniref:Nucleoside hydrolase n=1 Tax=Phytoactinopolyspora halophila TaxID=1981511 RepID=A0A329QDN7_9ACTN|nr:nucleoside hydrolase [Phytoactinopolyspora halophila]AYY13706.1 nucleoside hydrolase [Actinobacteria bacterium YIM 96077]RAW09362.1 nucleoside hydrolase [Phytoactinopolyspora halophila]
MPIPLVIDTDPGVDDMLALLVATGSPEIDLRAVTTTYGNVDLPTTTRNAHRIMRLAGRPDVPLVAGADRPLVHPYVSRTSDVHGDDGLGGMGHHLDDRPSANSRAEPAPPRAIDAIADVVRSSSTPVTLAALGPSTNAALFLARYPDLARQLDRIIMMGGAIAGGNITPVAEFNVASDPEATQRVFSDDVPVWMVGLDVTHKALVDRAWMDSLRDRGPAAQTAMNVMQHYFDWAHAQGRDRATVHDAVVLAELIAPGTLHFDTADVTIETGFGPARGCTVTTRHPAGRHRVAVDVNADAATTLIAERIAAVGTAA